MKTKTAVLSLCGTYRYRLGRLFAPADGFRTIAFIGVNPSTADAENDDATIRKCIGFASRLGYGKLLMGNKFAFRSVDVRELRTAVDPVGRDNDSYLGEIMRDADLVVAAWGPLSKLPQGALRQRWHTVASIAEAARRPLHCLGTALDGHPRHPLMLAYDTPLEPWTYPEGSVLR